MTNNSFETAACRHCMFSPFCMQGEHAQNSSKNTQKVVRQHRTLKRHETLYLCKNKFQNLYAIQTGALKTYQSEAAGKELIRGFYFSGEILGYEAIHTGQHLSSAVAIDDCVLCEIPYADFLNMLQSQPDLQKYLIDLLSQQLTIGYYLNFTTAEQRVAAFLLDLYKRLNPVPAAHDLLLPMSRQDIGNYLALTAETTSRVFSRLKKDKVILINRRKITLLQMDRLKQLAEG